MSTARNRIEEMVYSGFDQAIEKIIRAATRCRGPCRRCLPSRPAQDQAAGGLPERALARLMEEGIPVIIISGNHDAPKSFSSTSPFRLFEGLRDVHIAQRYKYERFEVGDHYFHCIPFCLEPQDYLTEFEKIERSGRDVLVMHGLVESLAEPKDEERGRARAEGQPPQERF